MTKGEAQEVADTYRQHIRAGAFRQVPDHAKDGQNPDARLTFGDVANAYLTGKSLLTSGTVGCVVRLSGA